MEFIAPKITKDQKGNYSLVFYVQGKRFRVANGKRFGLNINPNKVAPDQRLIKAQELQFRIHQALHEGWGQQPHSEMSFRQAVIQFKLPRGVKPTYREAFNRTQARLNDYLKNKTMGDLKLSQVRPAHCLQFLQSKPITPASFNNERKHLSSLLSHYLTPLELPNPVRGIKPLKEAPALHKPFADVQEVLDDIKAYNENLFTCCLLTYGCLLRPHQEIRQLQWSDFSADLSHISLEGRRNKSGRHRIVPVPSYVRTSLKGGPADANIFSGTEVPFNEDYFKTLWGKYKRLSNLISPQQTLYSFRHSGAIEIYKRTGSLQVLQQAMGHATLAVTLGYLRNLDLPVLTQDMMPNL